MRTGVRWFNKEPFSVSNRVRLKDKRKAKAFAKKVAEMHREIGLKARVIKVRGGYNVYTTYRGKSPRIEKIPVKYIDGKTFKRRER